MKLLPRMKSVRTLPCGLKHLKKMRMVEIQISQVREKSRLWRKGREGERKVLYLYSSRYRSTWRVRIKK